jgi:acetyltransferase-like isoleucine patch superfamily enzyme
MTERGSGRRAGGALVDAAASAVAAFHVAQFRAMSRLGVMTFQHASECASRTGTFFGYRVRQRFYQALLAGCGDGLEMNRLATVCEQASRIGTNVWVGPGAYLDLVDVGDEVLIGPGAFVLAGGRHHRTDRPGMPIRLQGNNPRVATVLGPGCWIGAGAVVMADVGPRAVVGAGAVVTKPVAADCRAVGNPAVVTPRTDAEAHG